MADRVRSKLLLVLAFAGTVMGTALVTAVMTKEHVSQAQEAKRAPAPPPAAARVAGPTWTVSAYFENAAAPTNGFIVVNQKTGKVANCIANWKGRRDAHCYDWSGWVRLP